MKGPSLDAIRKFKQQQEQKKREEDERKVQEKLTTLEHRAAQGDRKAKVQLKKIEQVQETKHDNNNQLCNTKSNSRGFNNGSGQINNNNTASSGNTNKNTVAKKCKPKDVETDFEELMRLAKNNTNEVKTQEKPKEKIDKIVLKRSNEAARAPPPDTNRRMPASRVDAQLAPMKSKVEPKPMPSTSKNLSIPPQHRPPRQTPHVSSRPAQHIPSRPPQHLPSRPPQHLPSRPPQHLPSRPTQHLRTNLPHRAIPAPSNRYRLPARHAYEDDDEDDYDDEDEYESDGFIVNEDDDEVREELSKTLKDVFRYDKRRCDLREQEVDRQYRAIGNVSTFEDLEREERRASRLAAAEDARELREEEERKRLKKIRLKGK